MSGKPHINRMLLIAAVPTVLALSACGGSGGTAKQTAQTPSLASTSNTTTTETKATTSGAAASQRTPNTSTATTQTSTSTTNAADHAREEAARNHAIVILVNCLRAHGVNMPPPNIKGPGPIADFSGVKTSTPQFGQARSICLPVAEANFNAAMKRH